jgi:acetate---CoA ligase (ADP-forming)
MAQAGGLSALMAPRAVAIVGASSDPARIGGRPVDYYRRAGFHGGLYPVNPNRAEVQGYRAYPSVADLPAPIDCALLAVPAAQLLDALDAVAAKGAGAAVIFTAGFAEIGAEGAALQAELAARARALGVRLLGPNCLGMFHAAIGHCPTFSSALQNGMPEPGRVGFVTQSGAYGTHLLELARERRIGVNYWVSTGNEADVGVAEVIGFLVDDPGTDVIGVYLEGVNHPDLLFDALERARRAKKPVALMKVGTSAAGAAAAASHTASLAATDDVFDAALREFGVARCRTTDQLLDVIYAASRAPLPRGRRLGILTISGGAGVILADSAEHHGLSTPPMPEAAQARLLERNPLASFANPLDVTANAVNDFGLVTAGLESMVRDGGYDMLASFFTSWAASKVLGPKLRAALQAARPTFAHCPHALIISADDAICADYESDGMMVFTDPDRAVGALAALAGLAEAFARPPRAPAPALPEGVPDLPEGAVGEHAAKEILAAAGVPILPEALVQDAKAAVAAARRMGLPVAMKIVSPDIAHKTEIGGVALDVASEEAVRAAHDRLVAAARKHAPAARLDGVLVAPMAGAGVELILGLRIDPIVGPVAMVGLGGMLTEAMSDVVLHRAPVTVAEARAMIGRLRGAAILKGLRGRPPADIDAAARALSALSVLGAAWAGQIDSIEINPLLVREHGAGAVALDALIVPRAAAAR